MTASRTRVASLAGVVWLLAATLAVADCEAPDRDCAAELPAACLQRMGAGAIAANGSGADEACEQRYSAYLSCLDVVIESCEPAPSAGVSCGEERETALWREARDAGAKEDLEFFLEVCPDSVFRRYAESRLADLETAAAVDQAADATAKAVEEAGDREEAAVELASLQSRREEVAAALAEHRSQGSALEAAQKALLASIALAKRNLDRSEALASRGVIAQRAVEAARSRWEEFSARNAALREKIAAKRALLNRARAELGQLDSDIASAKAKTGG